MRPFGGEISSAGLFGRRHWLASVGGVLGAIPLASLRANEAKSGKPGKVRRVIFLFMNGGPSQIDTFDPKPALAKYDNTKYMGDLRVNSGTRVAGTLWKSPFKFSRQGDSGIEISELFPELSRHVDELCIIRSMQTSHAQHAPAMLRMNTAHPRLGAASLGAWIDYGLGSLNENLPHYVVMLDHRGKPIAEHGNWSTGKLPVSAPSVITDPAVPIQNLRREGMHDPFMETRMQELYRALHQQRMASYGTEGATTTRNYELAWRMQQAVPEATNLAEETAETQALYGLSDRVTREFGTRCLLARRLLERGVRFVQIYSGGGAQKDTWDAHVGNVERHRQFAAETDRPIAALLQDLKRTGLLEETLVIWGGEFGRTPTREDHSNGRDHNPHGFTMWLAGGGVRKGCVVGATDELGMQAVESPYQVSDLQATLFHLLGLDHESLRFRDHDIDQTPLEPQPTKLIVEALT